MEDTQKRSVKLRSLDPGIDGVLTDPLFLGLCDDMNLLDDDETDDIVSNLTRLADMEKE